ncbi:MAG: YraN family protein [Cellvibrionaceae bacterium]
MWKETLQRVLHNSQKNSSLKNAKKMHIGHWAEKATSEYLQRQGLTLETCNFNCQLGEIDLIMRDGNQLVFVEVRFRKNTHYGSAIESVGIQKQKKIIKAAQCYLLEKKAPQTLSCRFDVMGVNITNGIPYFEWIKNAFY